ncbi:MAG: tRNA (5-methylaminomethyl-2-thiouridine)(34)-methyltransferase MnmD [Pseudomonadota bacterium]
MPEPIEWLEDGTPYSPRFGDRYRSESGGYAQARQVFLEGCGLPGAWAAQPQWRVLETGFGLGLNFLVTWQCWREDPARPALLHFFSTEAYPASGDDIVRALRDHPALLPLALELQAKFQGLMPGFHRLWFESGQVLLTLCIGDTKLMLREQAFEADSIYLDGFSPTKNPDIWDLHTLKSVARCARRGTRLATWTVARSVMDGLRECGFQVFKTPGVAPKRDNLAAVFDPAWEPRRNTASEPQRMAPAVCVVIGAGMAGAACASSLARRGWKVLVLDAGDQPAQGASGLPAGIFSPHVSPDESPLSRLSRAGVSATIQAAEALLDQGTDWAQTGVLQRRFDASGALPPDWPEAGEFWSRGATPDLLAAAGLQGTEGSPGVHGALWHAAAGWIRPHKLVKALLDSPSIEVRCATFVAGIERIVERAAWRILDAGGNEVAEAQLVVLAGGASSPGVLEHFQRGHAQQIEVALAPVHGELAWSLHPQDSGSGYSSLPPIPPLPPFPVNGNGNFIPRFATDGASEASAHPPAWLMGATYDRDPSAARSVAPQAELLGRLQQLLPRSAGLMEPRGAGPAVKSWSGVRCVSPDRLPVLGPVNEALLPGLWLCTAFGSRGLTLSILAAELMASWLHAEPLPIEKRLARSLLASRCVTVRPGPGGATST